MNKPNVLLLMCDQFRFDCIASLGNSEIHTPNLDRLRRRGFAFQNAYSTTPVCVPARYTLRTGREPWHTGCYMNEMPAAMDGLPEDMNARCGDYLAAAMRAAGYYTFGIGKYHAILTRDEGLGFDEQAITEELWETPEDMEKDAYLRFLRTEHTEYDHIEQPHGERTNMYYVPQLRAFPEALCVESFVAERAVEFLERPLEKPYFAFVSFMGPHPPFAPPIPYNRLYNPDALTPPKPGNPEIDHMDEYIPFMNHMIWADDIGPFGAQNLKARYYGEITYIDECIGRILDAVERREDADDTLILFFADHGDHLGEHNAWQKESYFEASCHIPFLLSWPARFPGGGVSEQLACLTDVFGIATSAAGAQSVRDGWDILGALAGECAPREALFAVYGRPGTKLFKLMLREGDWKYIYLSNGGLEQLFNLAEDPDETRLQNGAQPERLQALREKATAACKRDGLRAALEGDALRRFPREALPRIRVRQFNTAMGVTDFG